MVKIVWTELAILDLREIFEYIAEDSDRYAKLTVNVIYQKVQVLIANPYLGKIVPELNNKSIKELIEGNYRIIYIVKSDFQVDILRIYHSSRLLRINKLH